MEAVLVSVQRITAQRRKEEEEEDDEDWTGEWVRLPILQKPHVHRNVERRREYPPEDVDSLFDRGRPLRGKNRKGKFAIARTEGSKYEIWGDGEEVPVPRHNSLEKFFLLALVHALGFPDAENPNLGCDPPRRCFPDATYETLKLVVECDEEQHFNEMHRFNRLKPGYQRPRDRAVNGGYTKKGFYVLRVMACDLVFGSIGTYVAVTPLEMYERTLYSVREMFEIRRRNYHRGDFGGKLLLTGKVREPELFSNDIFNKRAVEAEAAKHAPLDDEGRARLRGTLLEYELRALSAEQFLRHQEKEERKRDVTIPIAAAIGSSLRITASSCYETKWRLLLEGYKPKERYDERVKRIDEQLARCGG